MRLAGPLLVDGTWTDAYVVCTGYVVRTEVRFADASSFPSSLGHHVRRVSCVAHTSTSTLLVRTTLLVQVFLSFFSSFLLHFSVFRSWVWFRFDLPLLSVCSFPPVPSKGTKGALKGKQRMAKGRGVDGRRRRRCCDCDARRETTPGERRRRRARWEMQEMEKKRNDA